jgi:branched-subunit amino acid aminotransferase/4-amino-4-deoxychorismate lyase
MQGKVTVESAPIEQLSTRVRASVSAQRIDPSDVFLYHKTSLRSLYDEELRLAQARGFFDVIFLNVQGEVTEGALSNIFILKKANLYTPPIRCGLLAGVLRQHLLTTGKAKEKILTLSDILDAERLYLGNSVRGLLETEISLADFTNKRKIKEYA